MQLLPVSVNKISVGSNHWLTLIPPRSRPMDFIIYDNFMLHTKVHSTLKKNIQKHNSINKSTVTSFSRHGPQMSIFNSPNRTNLLTPETQLYCPDASTADVHSDSCGNPGKVTPNSVYEGIRDIIITYVSNNVTRQLDNTACSRVYFFGGEACACLTLEIKMFYTKF